MSGALMRWTLRRTTSDFAPPKNEGFTFGVAAPGAFDWFGRRGAGEVVQQGEGVLDQTGWLSLALKLERAPAARQPGAAA